jgi:predicted transcriptional regulator
MGENKKHLGGRPLKYKTVEELQIVIDEYFDYCDNKTKEVHSEKLGDIEARQKIEADVTQVHLPLN